MGQCVQVRPGTLWIYVIRGDWADATPVIDPGGNQSGQFIQIRQVGGSLNAHARAQQHASRSDGSEVLLVAKIRLSAHGGVFLGSEVLNDHLLDVAEALMS